MTESQNFASEYTIVHHMANQDSAEISSVSKSDEVLNAIENFILLNKEVLDKSRKRELVDNRRMLCYLLRTYTNLSLSNIGKLLGGKDHATVMYGMKTHIELWGSKDQEYRFNTRELSNQFKNLL